MTVSCPSLGGHWIRFINVWIIRHYQVTTKLENQFIGSNRQFDMEGGKYREDCATDMEPAAILIINF